jgi:hypothetical protein
MRENLTLSTGEGTLYRFLEKDQTSRNGPLA